MSTQIVFGNYRLRSWGSGESWNNNAHDVDIDINGKCIVVGQVAGNCDLDPTDGVNYAEVIDEYGSINYVTCFDSDGNYMWSRWWESNQAGYFSIYEVDTDSRGSIYFTGHMDGTVDLDPATEGPEIECSSSHYICKLDSNGAYIWSHAWERGSGCMYTFGPSICTDPFDNVLVAGDFRGTTDFDPDDDMFELTSIGTGTDAYVTKSTSEGDFLFARRIGEDDDEQGDSFICVTTDTAGNIYLAGAIDGVADLDPGPEWREVTAVASQDILLMKLNPNGEL